MKILHAYMFFSIKFAGGTSDLMFKICKAQEKLGLEPTIYTGDYKFDKKLSYSLKRTRFRVLKSYFDKQGLSIMPSLKRKLNEDMKEIDIVHLHVYRTWQNLVLYYFCKKNLIPYILDAHGSVPLYERKRVLKRLFDLLWGKRILRGASFLIAETQVGVKEYLDVDPLLDKKKIKILSPPFDTDEFIQLPIKNSFRKKWKIDENTKVITFLGRVHNIKGIDFLIESFHELCKTRNDCLLLIVGPDDGFMEEYENLVRDLGIQDKVIFTGFIGGNDKNSVLFDSDIVVQTSRQEQGAWAPFEAVLCETPIIVTEHTGAGEDVKRIDAGETVKFGDKSQLVNIIEDILLNYQYYHDKTLKAKNFIENNLSMNERSKEYTNIYKEAIGEV